MLHNLEWLHDLEILYEASTFDTDPFEPQPDGADTIFPFWVPAPPSGNGLTTDNRSPITCSSSTPITDNRSLITGLSSETLSPGFPLSGFRFQLSDFQTGGYVELPYTLPQDSTLFLLFQQKDINLWKRKLDWVAAHGGMVLLNVHPDYLRFKQETSAGFEFPAKHYADILEYVRSHYAGQYWQPLPRDLAVWYKQQKKSTKEEPSATMYSSMSEKSEIPLHVDLSGKKAAVVLYSRFPSDPRPRRELEALCACGVEVDLICLQDEGQQPGRETHARLVVDRLPIQHERSGKGRYFFQYGYFLVRSFLMLAWRSWFKHYDLVHVHNMPDVLVFSSLVPKIMGAKVILDLHDPMPELYQTIFKLHPDSGMVAWLKRFEKVSIGFADLVLTPNESFKRLFSSRSCLPDKVQIIMNTPDERIFSPLHPSASVAKNGTRDRSFRIMYHGLIAERHGLHTAVHAVKILADSIPGLCMEIYGGKNEYLNQIQKLIQDLGLSERIHYCGQKRLEDIPIAIAESDLGIIPNLRTPFTEINFPTRIFEYLAMGKPLIVPRTQGIRDYFDDSQAFFFEPDSAEDLARMIGWVHEHPEETTRMVEQGRKVYLQHLWTAEKAHFQSMVSGLLAPNHKLPLTVPPSPIRS
jgi:glycosyltransferase involved in cell wall biosynthesis